MLTAVEVLGAIGGASIALSLVPQGIRYVAIDSKMNISFSCSQLIPLIEPFKYGKHILQKAPEI